MSIGERIKHYRKQKRLTQKELAGKANISRTYLADLERDRYNPSVDTLRALAAALGVDINELIHDESKSVDKYTDLNKKDERDIQKELERLIKDLSTKSSFAAFDGRSLNELEEEDRDLIIASLENTLRLAKRIAKDKYTPKKYKK